MKVKGVEVEVECTTFTSPPTPAPAPDCKLKVGSNSNQIDSLQALDLDPFASKVNSNALTMMSPVGTG